MAEVIDSLESAARKLGMSETVLFRLSQYFRLPHAAYASGETLVGRGDLGFTHQDILFFRKIRDQIVAGKSLEEMSATLKAQEAIPLTLPPKGVANKGEMSSPFQQAQPQGSALRFSQEASPPPASSAQETLREIDGQQPLKQQAKQSFESYKSKTQTEEQPPIFQQILTRMGGKPPRPGAKSPSPPKDLKAIEKTESMETDVSSHHGHTLGDLFSKPSRRDPLGLHQITQADQMRSQDISWPTQELSQEHVARSRRVHAVNDKDQVEAHVFPAMSSQGTDKEGMGLSRSLQKAALQIRERLLNQD